MEYANERIQFGKPIAKHQAVGYRLADMALRVDASLQLTWRAAEMLDRGERATAEAAMAKLHASETAMWCTWAAVQTLADRGLIEEAGRSQFGAALFKTSELFERLFGLSGLDQLPDPSQFDPTPEDERELRERLLKAGEQRAE